MPCSVALPAGTGKTEIITAVAAIAAEAGERALILTHTNAGVDALRRRMTRCGIPTEAARVNTIASWSHNLVRQYPQLAGITVPAEPDWAESKRYYDGAARVASSQVMRRVLGASYAFAIVDEYQDCSTKQHVVVTAVAEVLPVAALGDPLQAIFDWDREDPPAGWADVQRRWPALTLPVEPWRWHRHNRDLGQWLIHIRENFDHQRPIRQDDAAPVRWIAASDPFQPMVRACRELRNEFCNDSIVAIGNRDRDCHGVARSLNGTYTVMETIEGKDMLEFARKVDRANPAEVAAASAQWGKDCASQVASYIKSGDVRRLERGKSIIHLRRTGADQAQRLLSSLLDEPTPAKVREALFAIGGLGGIARYRHDAWSTVLRALAMAVANGTTVEAAVVQLRNRTRAVGRPATPHVISRTTLIKGLEYDHAIILNADQHKPTSLYVALTRARKTLTIISTHQQLQTEPPKSAKPRVTRRQPPGLWDDRLLAFSGGADRS